MGNRKTPYEKSLHRHVPVCEDESHKPESPFEAAKRRLRNQDAEKHRRELETAQRIRNTRTGDGIIEESPEDSARSRRLVALLALMSAVNKP